MSVPKEIGHIVLNVTDVERSTLFYRDVVGLNHFAFKVESYQALQAAHARLVAPMDISAPEPPRAEIPRANVTRVG
jgi:catechol-2,3-dioxygenase